MTDQELETEFRKAADDWTNQGVNPGMARFFFWAGAEVGARAAREIYKETVGVSVDEIQEAQ